MSAQGWCLDMAELHAEHEFPEHHYCKCWRANAPVPTPLGTGDAPLVPWQNAGGDNECEHGYAEGIPCPTCKPSLHVAEVAAARAEGRREERAASASCLKCGLSTEGDEWGRCAGDCDGPATAGEVLPVVHLSLDDMDALVERMRREPPTALTFLAEKLGHFIAELRQHPSALVREGAEIAVEAIVDAAPPVAADGRREETVLGP